MIVADIDLISSYAGLLSLATLSIYCGALGSVSTPKTKSSNPSRSKDDDDEEEEDVVDRLSAEDAWLFPILGSVMLFGMYLVVKYLGKEWINRLLGWYFALTGVAAVWQSSISLFRTTIGLSRWISYDKVHLSLTKGAARRSLVSLSLRTPSFVLFPLACIPSILYTLSTGSKSALLTNILGLSFAHTALGLLKLDSFRTGSILLAGLFVYDIWWVFGTEVMVKVATNLDLPIKILWPKSLSFNTEGGFTMLGLGDIVIPGTFIALALRYDHHRHVASLKDKSLASTRYSKPYFYAAMFAYVSGLVTTMTVMHVFRAAQPALLYLSPACILSFVLTATARGELSTAWKWSDDPAKDKADEAATRVQTTSDAPVEGASEAARLVDQSIQSGYGAVLRGAGDDAVTSDS